MSNTETAATLDEVANLKLLRLSVASELTGWPVSWIKRNVPVVKAPGFSDRVQLSDLKEAIAKRKDK